MRRIYLTLTLTYMVLLGFYGESEAKLPAISTRPKDYPISSYISCISNARPNEQNRCDLAQHCVEHGIAEWERQLKELPDVEHNKRGWLYRRMGQLYGYDEKLLAEAEKSYQNAVHEFDASKDTEMKAQAMRDLGVVQMRLGEMKNCIERHNSDSCIFPLSELARHIDKAGSLAAAKTFSEYLTLRPKDSGIRFLLNVVHQTLGTYPAGVPKQFLIPPSKFRAEMEVPAFRNVAPGLGIGKQQMSGGALMEDLRNNGLKDIVLTSMASCDGVLYYENDGKGGFVDKSDESGLGSQREVTTVLQVDYDNDGLLDLYLTRGAWDPPPQSATTLPPLHNAMMKNMGGGHFQDVTAAVGLLSPQNRNIASVWGDFNNDGKIDLFVCNENMPMQLFENRGGKFVNVIGKSGLPTGPLGFCKGAAWGDVNNDGWPDLFFDVYGDANYLYINQKDGTFRKSDQPALASQPKYGFSTWFFDYDNDGWLDLFIAISDPNPRSSYDALFGPTTTTSTPRLYRNLGHERFEDVTSKVGMQRGILSMGGNFGDFDNDGFEDIYLGTGGVTLADLAPNILLKNIGGKQFKDVTQAARVGNLQKGHGISFGDMRHSGKLDILAQFGGATPSDKSVVSLYENPGFGNNSVNLRLHGVKSNRAAIGSRVHLEFVENGNVRHVHRVVGPGGSFGSNSLEIVAGLGKARKINLLEITWAGSQTHDVYRDLSVNQTLDITEGAAAPKIIPRDNRSFRLDSGPHHHG